MVCCAEGAGSTLPGAGIAVEARGRGGMGVPPQAGLEFSELHLTRGGAHLVHEVVLPSEVPPADSSFTWAWPCQTVFKPAQEQRNKCRL